MLLQNTPFASYKLHARATWSVADLPTIDTLPVLADARQTSSQDSDFGVDEDAWLVHKVESRMLVEEANTAVWHPENFQMVKTLQAAPRNQGQVDLMKDLGRGSFVAVKRMPNAWVTTGHAEFAAAYPDSIERPWFDIGLVKLLHAEGFPYICQPHGVFRDHEHTYVAASFATHGDLFSYLEQGPRPGIEREDMIRPIVRQALTAVRWLHDLGIAHRDLSLENILLTEGEDGHPAVKLIDFGAAALTQECSKPSGKPSYTAPEMFLDDCYDAFLSDDFALGVLVFSLAACTYPWNSSRPGACKVFDFVRAHGVMPYFGRRKVGMGDSRRLSEAFSAPLADLIAGLLAIQPEERMTIGERVWGGLEAPRRPSAPSMAWLQMQP